MTAQGCRHICLTSRTGHARALAGGPLHAALNGAAMVVIARCDAASQEEVISLCAERDVAGRRVPMRGIIHCGGVLRDAPLRRQTLAGLREVTSPKAAASTLWHRLLWVYPTAQQVRRTTTFM